MCISTCFQIISGMTLDNKPSPFSYVINSPNHLDKESDGRRRTFSDAEKQQVSSAPNVCIFSNTRLIQLDGYSYPTDFRQQKKRKSKSKKKREIAEKETNEKPSSRKQKIKTENQNFEVRIIPGIDYQEHVNENSTRQNIEGQLKTTQ